MDLGAAADEVDIAVGVNAVSFAVDDQAAAHHVEGVIQLTLVSPVAVGRIDRIVGGNNRDVTAEDVHNRTLQPLVGIRHTDDGAGAVGVADGQDVVGVDGVVPGGNGEAAAQQGDVIVGVDAVVDCVDVHGHAVENEAGIVPGLDAVLGVAVDRQGAVAGHIDLGIGLGLEGSAVKGIRHVRIFRILIIRVFVVRQNHVAGDDDLDLGLLVDGNGRTRGAGQIQILEHQNHAGGTLLDRNIAVGTAAGNDIGAGRGDLNLAVIIGDGDIGGVFVICLQGSRAVGHGAGDNFSGFFCGADLGVLGRLAVKTAAAAHLGGLLAAESVFTAHLGGVLAVEAVLRCHRLRRDFCNLCAGFVCSRGDSRDRGNLFNAAAVQNQLGIRIKAVLGPDAEVAVVHGEHFGADAVIRGFDREAAAVKGQIGFLGKDAVMGVAGDIKGAVSVKDGVNPAEDRRTVLGVFTAVNDPVDRALRERDMQGITADGDDGGRVFAVNVNAVQNELHIALSGIHIDAAAHPAGQNILSGLGNHQAAVLPGQVRRCRSFGIGCRAKRGKGENRGKNH